MPEPEDAPPREGLGRLFLRFLRFGLLAWGGPVAQIERIRHELVEDGRWMSPERFQRALAVYQAIPGPEAHELCVHFGMLSRGRIGGLLAGLGFMLPGLTLVLLASWAYAAWGVDHALMAGVLWGFAPAAAALVAHAVARLARSAFRDPFAASVGVAAAVLAAFLAPFWAVLPAAGAAQAVRGRWGTGAAALFGALAAGAILAAFATLAPPVPDAAAEDTALAGASAQDLARTGLKAGFLTFGGAYTAIPFVQGDAVGAWMTQAQFLDGLAITSLLPAPLIAFTAFVGYLGGGLAGALLVTACVFLPAFGFTLVGFRHLERAMAWRPLHAVLDGVAAAVVGLAALTAVGLAAAAVRDPLAAAVFLLALTAFFHARSPHAVPATLAAAGAAGLVLQAIA